MGATKRLAFVMKKHKFTSTERFAIWRAYSEKCFYCEQPLALTEVNIDHILPEHILDDPQQLEAIKSKYGLGMDFSINDYCNWVPAHQGCNRRKGTTLYSASPAFIMILENAKRKGKQAKKEADRLTKNKKAGDILGKLGIALQGGIISTDEVEEFLNSIPREHELYEPLVITFSLNLDEVLKKSSPTTELPTDYYSLCDWLEKDLIKQLSSLLTCSFFYPEASQNTGETLSIRLAFLQLNLNELDKFTSPWWEILEIDYYSEVYGSMEWARLRHKTQVQNAPVLNDREFMELLYRGVMLMSFIQITKTDYRAIAFSQDHVLYQSDSYYDLDTWREILELANIEDWEIKQALAKIDDDLI
jgi:hypothetical protein